MLPLLLALSLGQVRPLALPNPAGPIFTNPATLGSFAFFEFAPASGAGMGAACACAAVTGAKGEAVTFTRTGNATCSRQGLATTGINNGDLVSCGANLPRVESSGGVLGLRVESSRTNSVLRSEEIDNAAWVDDVLGVVAPTITANAATAPDGTLTAERVQLPAVTGAQYSLRRQAIAAASTGNASVYVRGNGTSGSISIAADGALTTAIDCAYVSTSWSRCTLSAGGSWIFIGTITGFGATSASKVAQDVFLWGAQTEGAGVATYPTSYIPTVASAVTRNAELVSVALVGPVSTGSMSVTAAFLSSVGTLNNAGLLSLEAGASFRQSLISLPAQQTNMYVGGVSLASTATTTAGPNRLVGWWNATTTAIIRDGTQTTGAAGAPAASDTLRIGNYSGSLIQDGLYSRVCVDPDPTRCR